MAIADQSRRIAELEALLQEANETLDAIRNGEVDAIVVGGEVGQFVYTLENADRPYRVLVEQMKEGAVTLNADCVILYVNRSFSDLVKQASGRLIGSCLYDHVVDPGPIKAMLSGAETATIEVMLIRRDGQHTPANMSIVELQVEAGAPKMFCSIVTDLSEKRAAENVLRQVQKMDAVGQLTGGIAHDFNNLLMAISSSLEMLEKRVSDDPQTQRLLDNARQGAQRGAALTQRMLAFARRQDLKAERVDLTELTRGMMDLLQRTLGPAWSLQIAFSDDLPPVLADANQIEMALLNLAVNARDALPDGGDIIISAELAVIDADQKHGLRPGRYVCLSVIDGGEGMDADTLMRATEPFFTTKGVGKGTGLGLPMVHGLAKQLGGTFVLQSSPDDGTTACLWLPAADETFPESPAPIASDDAPADIRPMRILAVDDDVLIRMNVSSMLEDMGHEVFDAGSGETALELLRQEPGIQLLITDQAMPRMTGTELIQHVADERPALPIILATGYGELPAGAPAHIVKLNKPFSEQELARAIEVALSLTRSGV
ncbi:MAG: response regulator [Novosphingobium sp.]|nr:MAG: response regulator [Novosphingobium sp.]